MDHIGPACAELVAGLPLVPQLTRLVLVEWQAPTQALLRSLVAQLPCLHHLGLISFDQDYIMDEHLQVHTASCVTHTYLRIYQQNARPACQLPQGHGLDWHSCIGG